MVTDIPPPTSDSDPNGGGGGVNSPHSLRQILASPWASIVRGGSEQNSSPTASASAAAAPGPSSSPPVDQAPAPDNSEIDSSGPEPQPENTDVNGGDGNAPRRPAWNRPLNGVVEPAASVMGGTASWPALSEVRAVPRSPSDTPRPVSDGSAAPSQAPLISQPPPQRPVTNNSHVNSTGNNSMSSRLRSRNRGGGGGGGGGGSSSSGSGPSHNTFSHQPAPPMPPPFPTFEVAYPMIPAVVDNSVRGARPIGGVGASQSHAGNDHSFQRNNSRRGGYGSRPRGDGSYHNNHGGRRDQDRRDVHPPQYMPPPPPPMGYMGPPPLPPGAAPYMAPPPMRVYGPQMGFDMTPPFIYVPSMAPESFRPMPMVPPLAPMIFSPPNENPLTSMIVKQIDFYFSDDNLAKDSYLRLNMDDHGWVPVALIANFRRVQQLTKDIPLILDSLRHSIVVEVQGDKIRRRSDWSKWLMSSSGSHTPSSAPENVLATSLQGVSLDDARDHLETAESTSLLIS